MNVATTQLTTRLRTWALVAGLTALTIAIGAMLGGTFLWLFVAFAVAFNVVGYFFSDRIALRVAHARPIRFAEAPELYAIVDPLAERADIRQREYLADATAAMYIANPLGGGTVATLFFTHPPVRERIRRLRAYGQRARTERTASTARLSGA